MTPITKVARREFLQLADTFDPKKHKIAGFYISEKLDGTRCFWDGGLTRDMPTAKVPWASVRDPKTGERKGKIKPKSTGLWSRYGNPIMAPDWFLNQLPCVPLDGELWAGPGSFQLCRSICGGDAPDPRFKQIKYAVYSSPALSSIFQTGLIKNTNFLLDVDIKVMEKFVLEAMENHAFAKDFTHPLGGSTFEDELVFLRGAIEAQNDYVFLHQQIKLSADEDEARAFAEEYCAKVLDRGGEGCIIRDPHTIWTPKRHRGLLKYKPYADAEAVVIGYVAGKEGKQGNVLGKIGALKVRTIGFDNNVEFEIGSGLTFEEREFASSRDSSFAANNPGEEVPGASGRLIPRGSTITFKYRELSTSDPPVPKEARFWRRREGIE